MKLEHFFDWHIMSFQGKEAIPEGIAQYTNYDVIRIYEPTLEQRRLLLPQGFIYKPESLFWFKHADTTLDDYLLSLRSGTRNDVRKAIKTVEANCQIRVDWCLQKQVIEEWLALYRRHIARLTRGMDIASKEYPIFLAEPESFAGLFLYYERKLVAGGICRKVPGSKTLRLKYLACEAAFHSMGLARYIYYMLFSLARETGYQIVSAGVDLNFYGHALSTGLYLFKMRMGFTAEPKYKHELPGRDVLEKILSLRKCETTSFTLGYAETPAQAKTLVGHVFSKLHNPDISRFKAPFLEQLHFHHMKE